MKSHNFFFYFSPHPLNQTQQKWLIVGIDTTQLYCVISTKFFIILQFFLFKTSNGMQTRAFVHCTHLTNSKYLAVCH